MSDRSEFTLDLSGVQVAPSPFGQNVRADRSIRRTLLPGDATDEIRAVYAAEFVLALSTTVAVDLRLVNDRFGNGLLLDDIAVIFVENVEDPTGGGALELRPSAANGLTTLLGVGSAVKLPSGSFFCVGNFVADRIDVTAAIKSLDFVETGGALPVLVRLHVWGRR